MSDLKEIKQRVNEIVDKTKGFRVLQNKFEGEKNAIVEEKEQFLNKLSQLGLEPKDMKKKLEDDINMITQLCNEIETKLPSYLDLGIN